MLVEIPREILSDNNIEPKVKILIGIRYSLILHEKREDRSITNDEYENIFRCLVNKYRSSEQILFLAHRGEVLTVDPEAVRALNV